MRLTLLWLLLFGFVCSCAAKKKVSFPDEKFTAEQIYERRGELFRKVIRAEFYWWWGRARSDVRVTAGDGTMHKLGVEFDGGKIPKTNPTEWKKFQIMQHVFAENLDASWTGKAVRDLPTLYLLRMDADVEVTPPDEDPGEAKRANAAELVLRLVHIHAIREIEPTPSCEHYPPASAPSSR